MSFPNVLFGPDNEVFNTYTDRRWPLGTRLITADGRVFRFGLAGASNLAAGKLHQAPAPVTNHVLQTPTAASVGATTVSVALGATAVTKDQYRDGVLSIELGTGQGYAYKIDSHAAVSSSGTFVVPLTRGITVQVAIPATSNSVSLVQNPYSNIIVAPTTLTSQVCGVPVSAITAAQYGWFQTRGLAAVLVNGTVVIGNRVVPSLTTAGAVEAASGTFAVTSLEAVGRVAHVATSTNYSTIDLCID